MVLGCPGTLCVYTTAQMKHMYRRQISSVRAAQSKCFSTGPRRRLWGSGSGRQSGVRPSGRHGGSSESGGGSGAWSTIENLDVVQLLNGFIRLRSSRAAVDRRTAAASASKIYRRSTHPTSVPLSRILSGNFPLTIRESLEDYVLRNNPLVFQDSLLSLLPFYPYPDAQGRSSKVLQTYLSSGNFINEFVIYPPNKTEADSANLKHLILVHGYGSGLGLYLKNFDALASKDDWCIHAIDLMGYGCSSRPPFSPKTDDLDGVEEWFHAPFTEWLDKRGLAKLDRSQIMVVAHSMGAYLMASYGIKVNPDFCKTLVMVSPGAVIKHRKQIFVPKYFARLWERNISPFTLVRKAGALGSKLVSGWSFRRFSNLDPEEAKRLHRYAYGIFQSPGSGEYMLNYLLAPGADARFPLAERDIHKLNCNVLWCYGKEDWMDIYGGQLCSKLINDHHHSKKSTVVEIENSGHHIYLDNYKKFNELINKLMVYE